MSYEQTKIPAIALFCLALVTLALSQSRNVLQNRYGSPVGDVYRTPNGLLIKATFSKDNLCAAEITAEGRKIKDAELKTVLEEIAPKEERGKYVMGTFLNDVCVKTDDFGKLTEANACGGVSEDYERLSITKWGNTDDYTAVDVTYYRGGCKSKRPHHAR